MWLILFIKLIEVSYAVRLKKAIAWMAFCVETNAETAALCVSVASAPVVVLQPVLRRVLQIQIAVVFGFEINHQAVVIVIFDYIGHIDQLGERFARNRVRGFNAVHRTPP